MPKNPFEPSYRSVLWGIVLADEWEAESEEDCVTLYHPDGVGALQISGFRKESDGEVTRSDLLGFATVDAETQNHLAERRCGDFTGFELAYSSEGTFWRKWWLASGRTMLFVTYNADLEHEGVEQEAVNAMMESLTAL
jgi:hypothetical protein